MTTNQPCCLLAVDTAAENVAHRFIDEEIVKQLTRFVNSKNNSISLNIATHFRDKGCLQKDIKTYTTTAYTEKLKLLTAKELINEFNSDLSISEWRDDRGSILHMKGGWITDIMNPEALFDSDATPTSEVIDFRIVDILGKYLPGFSVVLISGAIGVDRSISGRDGTKNTTCLSYSYKGNMCYRTKSGLVLMVSPCKNIDGKHIHELGFVIGGSAYDVVGCEYDYLAFQEIVNSNMLSLDGHVLSPDLSEWKELKSLLCLINEMYEASRKNIISFSGIKLKHFESAEVSFTVGLISCLINESSINKWFPGFCFEADAPENNDFDEIESEGHVPLAFCISGKTFIAMMSARFSWLLNSTGEHIIGFKINSVIDYEIQKLEWSERSIDVPELWLHDEWPAIRLLNTSNILDHQHEKRPYALVEESIT